MLQNARRKPLRRPLCPYGRGSTTRCLQRSYKKSREERQSVCCNLQRKLRFTTEVAVPSREQVDEALAGQLGHRGLTKIPDGNSTRPVPSFSHPSGSILGQVVFLQFAVQGRAIDTQGLGRLRDVVVCDFESVD